MNTYRVSVAIEVEVQAFDEGDALEAVQDCFGPGDQAGLKVTEYQLLDHEQL